MKKRFIMLFAVMAMLLCLPIIANAETGSKYGDYLYYEVNGDNTGITITDCDKAATEIVIPNVIDELPVTSLYDSAFEDCSSLTNIVIPDSVTSIGYNTFSGCSGLEDMTIPDSVTSIGRYAFWGCSGLKTLTLGKGIKHIGFEAFAGCTDITTLNYNIAKCGITTTNSSGFDGYYPFSSCPIETVNIGESVESIGKITFWGCTGIKTINLNATNCTSMGSLMVYSSGAESTFRDCTALTTVNIGENVTKIPDYAFIDCKSLTSITIPENVTNIGARAFYNCTSLATLNFNAIDCSSSIDGGGDNIKFYPFGGCSLKTVNIGEKVTKIPHNIFYKCKGITNIDIPDSVTSIGNLAFSGCSGLTNIVIPENVTNIGNSAFSGCSGLTSIVIPNNVANIGSSAFSNCKNLINVTISDSVKTIGAEAFSNCTNLKHLTIPSGVTKINDSTFYGCEGLKSLTIPDSVTVIDSDVFYHCYSLYDIYYAGNEEQWKRVYNYDTVPSIATIHYNSSYSPELEPVPTPTPTPYIPLDCNVDYTVENDEITFEVEVKDAARADELNNIQLFKAIYNENGQFTGVTFGTKSTVNDGKITITTEMPDTDAYKFFLWDGHFAPLMEVIDKENIK